MAPSTPVYSRAEVFRTFGIAEDPNGPDALNCTLYSLTQNECTITPGLEGAPAQVICLPFKRLFKRCLLSDPKQAAWLSDGIYGKRNKNQIPTAAPEELYVDIEVTAPLTNTLSTLRASHGDELDRFLGAEKALRLQFDNEYPFRSG